MVSMPLSKHSALPDIWFFIYGPPTRRWFFFFWLSEQKKKDIHFIGHTHSFWQKKKQCMCRSIIMFYVKFSNAVGK